MNVEKNLWTAASEANSDRTESSQYWETVWVVVVVELCREEFDIPCKSLVASSRVRKDKCARMAELQGLDWPHQTARSKLCNATKTERQTQQPFWHFCGTQEAEHTQ